MKLFAVIPTIGERNETLFPMCRQLEKDGVTTIVVYNRRDPADEDLVLNIPFSTSAPYVQTHYWQPDEPVNLSAVWNMGLDWVEELAGGEEFTVAVFNDDLTLPPGLVQAFADAIMRNDAAGAFPAFHSHQEYVLRTRGPVPLHLRMTGFAFALRGSKGIRADEDLLWWYGDDMIDNNVRDAGGNVGVPGLGVVHHDPNGYTARDGKLAEQAGRDRQTFIAKTGFAPW